MSEENKTFRNALSNFTMDVAARGGIRHLYDLGYDATSIRAQLTFPVSEEQIKKEISENEPVPVSFLQDEFIKETDAYGKTSFRRVLKS